MKELTVEQVKRGREFMIDLRANEKKAVGVMRERDGSRCCLAVAVDTANRMGAELPLESSTTPPEEICEWYGWSLTAPYLKHPDLDDTRDATAFNDGLDDIEPHTHKEIADLFELTYPQLKDERA